jgi:hypothetical protein
MKRIITLAILTLCASAAFASKTYSVTEAINGCYNMNDFCSGFVNGALYASPTNGPLSVCVPDGQTLGTTDRLVADWIKNETEKGRHFRSGDSAMMFALWSIYPCK